jgi:hypothetical protein
MYQLGLHWLNDFVVAFATWIKISQSLSTWMKKMGILILMRVGYVQ